MRFYDGVVQNVKPAKIKPFQEVRTAAPSSASVSWSSLTFLSVVQRSRSERSAVGSEGWEEGESEEEEDEQNPKEDEGGGGGEEQQQGEEGEEKKGEKEETSEEKEGAKEEEEERTRKAEPSSSHPPAKKKTDNSKMADLLTSDVCLRLGGW